jgi:glutathione peroxidase
MMKTVLLTTLALLLSPLAQAACPDYLDTTMRKLHSKEEVNFCEAYAGHPMLIVNTASHCGYTKQFKGLESVHQRYGEQGLVVVGFASDSFKQEANDEAKAADICYKNYGVSFTMIAPTPVRGDDANPVFQQLGSATEPPSWNFNKYLVNSDGEVVAHFGSRTTPDSEELANAIEELL